MVARLSVEYHAAWHCRAFIGETPCFGADCVYCGRAIAVPLPQRKGRFACVYCGMDRGAIPAVEAEPNWHRSALSEG